MKYFTPIQKISLGVLSAIVIVLAIVEFTTAGSLSRSDPSASPQVVVIKLANTPTPSPELIPLPEELQGVFGTASPTVTPAVTPFAPTSTVIPSACQSTAKPTVASGDIFTLTIRKQNIGVASGVDEATLENGPGWLTTSASPGQEGVCVVYGHRNRNHLKPLEKVDYGDIILVTAKNGAQYSYRVESVEIVGADDELRIPTMDGPHLMLVTCYPFYYSGHAPKKYVVMAKLGCSTGIPRSVS